MSSPEQESNIHSKGTASDHLANERTYLAWIRTSIGIMAFGFVVVKFALFIKQISLVLGKQSPTAPEHGYSFVIGILLVIAGAFTTFFSYFRYQRVRKQLDDHTYRSSSAVIIMLSVFVLAISIALAVYLIQSI
jgi:putative membrane protein